MLCCSSVVRSVTKPTADVELLTRANVVLLEVVVFIVAPCLVPLTFINGTKIVGIIETSKTKCIHVDI